MYFKQIFKFELLVEFKIHICVILKKNIQIKLQIDLLKYFKFLSYKFYPSYLVKTFLSYKLYLKVMFSFVL